MPVRVKKTRQKTGKAGNPGNGHDTATLKAFPGAVGLKIGGLFGGLIGDRGALAANRFATRILAVQRQKRHCRRALMPPCVRIRER
jgi:hypothetical protein